MPGPCSDSERGTSHHLHTKHITDSLEAASSDVVTTLRHSVMDRHFTGFTDVFSDDVAEQVSTYDAIKLCVDGLGR